jgi:hypothetical protein
MHYKLLGFSQRDGVRIFWFHRIGPLGTKPVPFHVLADTGAARQYKVPLQDLPSLCSRLLNAKADSDSPCAVTVGDRDLQNYAAGVSEPGPRSVARPRRVEAEAQPEQPSSEATPAKVSTGQLYDKFKYAFRRYSAQSARLREMSAAPEQNAPTSGDIAKQSGLVSEAENSYRAIRMEYALVLLAGRDREAAVDSSRKS